MSLCADGMVRAPQTTHCPIARRFVRLLMAGSGPGGAVGGTDSPTGHTHACELSVADTLGRAPLMVLDVPLSGGAHAMVEGIKKLGKLGRASAGPSHTQVRGQVRHIFACVLGNSVPRHVRASPPDVIACGWVGGGGAMVGRLQLPVRCSNQATGDGGPVGER